MSTSIQKKHIRLGSLGAFDDPPAARIHVLSSPYSTLLVPVEKATTHGSEFLDSERLGNYFWMGYSWQSCLTRDYRGLDYSLRNRLPSSFPKPENFLQTHGTLSSCVSGLYMMGNITHCSYGNPNFLAQVLENRN